MLRGLKKSTARSHAASRNGGSRERNRDLRPCWELEVEKRADRQGKCREVCGSRRVNGRNQQHSPPTFHRLAEPRGWFQGLEDVGIERS